MRGGRGGQQLWVVAIRAGRREDTVPADGSWALRGGSGQLLISELFLEEEKDFCIGSCGCVPGGGGGSCGYCYFYLRAVPREVEWPLRAKRRRGWTRCG